MGKDQEIEIERLGCKMNITRGYLRIYGGREGETIERKGKLDFRLLSRPIFPYFLSIEQMSKR